jgi:hypothetical protein
MEVSGQLHTPAVSPPLPTEWEAGLVPQPLEPLCGKHSCLTGNRGATPRLFAPKAWSLHRLRCPATDGVFKPSVNRWINVNALSSETRSLDKRYVGRHRQCNKTRLWTPAGARPRAAQSREAAVVKYVFWFVCMMFTLKTVNAKTIAVFLWLMMEATEFSVASVHSRRATRDHIIHGHRPEHLVQLHEAGFLPKVVELRIFT